MKYITNIILVILLLAVGFIWFDTWQMNKKYNNAADTIIYTTINHVFDTVLHSTQLQSTTVNNPVKIIYYPYHDSLLCDSVRVYMPSSADSNIEIYSTITTQGKLIDAKFDYKFLRPVFTEKITVKEINKYISENGLFIGASGNVLYGDPIRYGMGINVGYKYKNWIISYSGETNGVNLLQINRMIK